jgi:Restriction endonuclease XhoI
VPSGTGGGASRIHSDRGRCVCAETARAPVETRKANLAWWIWPIGDLQGVSCLTILRRTPSRHFGVRKEALLNRFPDRAAPSPAFGRHGDPLVELIADELERAGLAPSSIRKDELVVLPWSYQQTPQRWDLVVTDDGIPAAIIEMVSMVGTSVQKNLRNRMDEIVARAANADRAYGSTTLRPLRPCLGLVAMIEESPATITPLRNTPPSLPGHSPSEDMPRSSITRFLEFSQRLLRDELYDTICFLTTTAPPAIVVGEPDSRLGFTAFIEDVVARVAELQTLRREHNLEAAEIGRMLANATTSTTSSPVWHPPLPG